MTGTGTEETLVASLSELPQPVGQVRAIDLRPPAVCWRDRVRQHLHERALRRARRSSVDSELMADLQAGHTALRSVLEWSKHAEFAVVHAAALFVAMRLLCITIRAGIGREAEEWEAR